MIPTSPSETTSLLPARNIPVVIQDQLRSAILRGDLEAESRLNIDEIAERFGVSKIPVREALRMLESDGWVYSRPHRGTYVRPLSQEELTEIFEMRKLMEPHSAELAAQRCTPEHVKMLRDLIKQSRTAISSRDLQAIAQLNQRLHGAIASVAGNRLLAESLEKLDLLMRRYFVPISWEARRESMLQHVAIVEAIANKDSALAKELALAHIQHTESVAYLRLTTSPSKA